MPADDEPSPLAYRALASKAELRQLVMQRLHAAESDHYVNTLALRNALELGIGEEDEFITNLRATLAAQEKTVRTYHAELDSLGEE